MPRAYPDPGRYGPWALVAGAARGLGAEYARQLAQAGFALALVDVDAEALTPLAEDLRARGTEVLAVPLDLAAPNPSATLLPALGGREVGLLVVNAALALVGPFLAQPLDAHQRVLAVNAAAALDLVYAFARPMVARGRGGVVLMASLAGFQGTARVVSYAATKAFLLGLGEGLGAELRPQGVDVLVVAPGATSTETYLATQPKDDRGPLMTPGAVVQEALRSLGRRPLLVPGRGNRAAHLLLTRLLPRRAAVWIMARAMAARYPG